MGHSKKKEKYSENSNEGLVPKKHEFSEHVSSN
jgi:hypothetical protein